MSRRARNRTPALRPVHKVELSDKYVKLRWIAALCFLVIGAVAIGYGINALMTPETGWTEIEGSSYGSDITFTYNLGASGVNARAEKRSLTALYTQITEKAYKVFHSSEEFDAVNNLCSLNQHPNETLEVAPELYQALALLEQYGARWAYLGPIYENYDGLFTSGGDAVAAEFDPYANEDLRTFYGEVAAYAADPEAIRLELQGDNRVQLYVSGEYLDFAVANEIQSFVDLYWMKNAFIVDMIADTIRSNGYYMGYITSCDGFMRNLDTSGSNTYGLDLYDREEQVVYPAAIMEYGGDLSIVVLRDYPLVRQDVFRYYQWSSGEIRTQYVDIRDGLSRTSAHDLTAYSENYGCAELLLQIAPIYIGAEFDEAALTMLKDVQSIWFRDYVLYHTDREIVLPSLYDRDGVTYTAVPAR